MALPILVRRTKIRVFRSLPVFLYSCETWTPAVLFPFAESLVTDGVTIQSIDLVLRMAGLGQVTRIVLERRVRLYGHAAPIERYTLRGIPLILYLLSRSEVLDHAEGASTRFIILASVGDVSEEYGHGGCLPGRWPREYRRKVDAATRCSDVFRIPDLT